MTTLITGAAGFIGMHVIERLLERGDQVVGIDNLNDYYSPQLKRDRIASLARHQSGTFEFREGDFADAAILEQSLGSRAIDAIVHLGAQPGVRYSIENPAAYIHSNLVGHANLVELARRHRVRHFVYASSSSVYGGNTSLPFSVEERVDQPLSLYAATKKADELISETYAHLYRIPSTGLRFFTVYGPWGRPDMAPWLFTEAILSGRPIKVHNGGRMQRDFTYIKDIVDGVVSCLDRPPADDGTEKSGGSRSPHAIYNIGNHQAVELNHFIDVVEQACGRTAVRELTPMQPGDVVATFADIKETTRDLGFFPTFSIEQGIPRFVEWYRAYHKV